MSKSPALDRRIPSAILPATSPARGPSQCSQVDSRTIEPHPPCSQPFHTTEERLVTHRARLPSAGERQTWRPPAGKRANTTLGLARHLVLPNRRVSAHSIVPARELERAIYCYPPQSTGYLRHRVSMRRTRNSWAHQ